MVWNNVTRFGFVFADSFTYGHYIDAYDGEGTPLHELPSKGPEEVRQSYTQFTFARLSDRKWYCSSQYGLSGGDLLRKRFTSHDFAGLVCATHDGVEEFREWNRQRDMFPVCMHG
eukprot:SAG31_NODE_2920_length_4909_cov_14.892100_5_plen_115_part_00